MRRYEDVFRITTMCRVLSVTPQGYYAWKKRPPSTRAVANEALLVEIRASHLRSKRSYGSPRVWRDPGLDPGVNGAVWVRRVSRG